MEPIVDIIYVSVPVPWKRILKYKRQPMIRFSSILVSILKEYGLSKRTINKINLTEIYLPERMHAALLSISKEEEQLNFSTYKAGDKFNNVFAFLVPLPDQVIVGYRVKKRKTPTADLEQFLSEAHSNG